MIAWFSIAPDDGSGSYSKHAAAVQMVEASGLRYRLGAMGTEVKGTRDEVLVLLARCHTALATARAYTERRPLSRSTTARAWMRASSSAR